jgi:membrane fusion protein (multidrug efflux system)
MKKRMAIMLILVTIIFGGIVGFYFFKQAMIAKFMSHMGEQPSTVTTTKVQAVTWAPTLTAVGTLAAEQSVALSPQVSGMISAIYFDSGKYVTKGDPLVDLESSTQVAQLKADQAQLKLAQLNYARDQRLYKQHAIASAGLDSSFAALQSAQAAVEGDLATIAKMHIVAPFSGKLGIRQVSLGQYLAAGSSTTIVQLSSIDPILVQFNLPQQELPKIFVGQGVQLTVDAFPGQVFSGKITATNSDITSGSRTMLVEAKIPNPTHALVSGMFAMVNVLLPVEKNVIVVPQTAIVYSLYGDSVYVVKSAANAKGDAVMTVTQEFVTIGETQGINVRIEKGLTAGAEVVTSGQLKLHNGSTIIVNNSVLPN